MKTALILVLGAAIGYGASHLPKLVAADHGGNQPYSDEQGRPISSLSASDVAQLQAGEGWGLAKPAEFNGYPGPAHVIEFADKLELDLKQRSAVNASYDRMKSRAIEAGNALIEAERALDETFVSKTATPGKLEQLLNAAESRRAELRAVHLAAHLEVTPLLSDAQKAKYASLRGYADGHGGH